MYRRLYPVFLITLFGILGTVCGLVLGLSQDDFGSVITVATAPCGMWLGLFIGLLVAHSVFKE